MSGTVRVGGQAGGFEGFTRTLRDVSTLDVEDELKQVRFYSSKLLTQNTHVMYARPRVLTTAAPSCVRPNCAAFVARERWCYSPNDAVSAHSELVVGGQLVGGLLPLNL